MSRIARAAATGFYRPRVSAECDWPAVGVTSRAELVRDQLDHPPLGSRGLVGRGHVVRAGATGSGSDLLVLAWTERELALERAAGARMLQRLEIPPATPIANTLPGALTSPGSLLFGDVVEEHGGLDVPLGEIGSDAAAKQAWELLDRVTPGVLCLEPATAARFLSAAPAAARPWLRGILFLWRAAPAVAVEVPAAIGFSGWQRVWLAVPEASCFAASSCGAGNLHGDRELRLEVIGGRLVVTPLEGDTALLRYDAGLRADEVDPCPCGGPGFCFRLGSPKAG